MSARVHTREACARSLLTEADDTNTGGNPVAVLGYSYWDSRFGLDPGVLNQPIIINGFPMTIVGVAQKGFGSGVAQLCEATGQTGHGSERRRVVYPAESLE